MAQLEVLEIAHEELTHAAEWYDARRPGTGGRFLTEADEVLARIGEFPLAGARREPRSHSVRRVLFRSFPYAAIYVTQPRLVVVAFAHVARRPDYWIDRLDSLPQP